jgi:hypothetical protein
VLATSDRSFTKGGNLFKEKEQDIRPRLLVVVVETWAYVDR